MWELLFLGNFGGPGLSTPLHLNGFPNAPAEIDPSFMSDLLSPLVVIYPNFYVKSSNYMFTKV